MGDRAVLGPADVDDALLARLVGAQIGLDDVQLRSAAAEVADYDLEALTTAGRYWVHGTATGGDGAVPFRFFVKVVQSWERSPFFQWVPEAMRADALASIPWRREPDVYRSDLGDRLPEGLTMPAARHVADMDDLSAAIWLDAVPTEAVRWDLTRFRRAAYLLGRLAASPAVAPVGAIGDVGNVHRSYARGRLTAQVVPALHDDDLWRHPVMVAGFPSGLREELIAAAERVPAFLDELDTVPVGTLHGDACTRNLLVRRGGDDGSFVLIDYGFWGRGPLGFDLSQLLLGEVQTGERPARDLTGIEEVALPAYVEGLAAEGVAVSAAVVRRSHALVMLLFSGLSAIPFELLAGPPGDETIRVARERALAARFILDLVDGTEPLA